MTSGRVIGLDRPRKEGCHGGGVYSFFPGEEWGFMSLEDRNLHLNKEIRFAAEVALQSHLLLGVLRWASLCVT